MLRLDDLLLDPEKAQSWALPLVQDVRLIKNLGLQKHTKASKPVDCMETDLGTDLDDLGILRSCFFFQIDPIFINISTFQHFMNIS